MPRPEHGDEFEAEGEGPEEGKGSEEWKASEEGKGRKKRIDLSVAQVAGAGVATLTAATAASYLNVYGTVIGTGVMAVLSTSAAPVIQHWITRSSEQAKELAEKKSAKQPGVRALVESDVETNTGHPESGFDTGAARVVDPDDPNPYGFPEETDATRTMAMPMVGRELPGQTVAHGFGNPEDPALAGGPAAADATELLPPVGGGPSGSSGAHSADGSDEGAGAERSKRGWRTAVISAAAVFTLVMLVILAFELLTGRSLTAWTQGQDEPTSPSLFGGHSAPAQVEEEDPETTGDDDRPQVENDPGTQDQGTDVPVDPEPTTPPPESQPDVPGGGGQTDPTDPPVDGEDPVEPGDGDAPDPGTENPPEGNDAPPEPAPAPGG